MTHDTQCSRHAGALDVRVADHEPASDTSLAGFLNALGPDRLASIRSRLAVESPHRVLQAYRQAFAQGEREKLFLCSEALAVNRHVPPCFRLDGSYSAAHLPDALRFDLLAHDLQWVMSMYPDQWRHAKGGHSGMLHGASWLAVAEHYWSTKNQRDTWLMVRQVALTVDQQWECAFLRSAPVKRAALGLAIRQATVQRAITGRLAEANRVARGRSPLEPAYERRFKVWVCGEMTDRSPTKTARLYELWTGAALTRSVAHTDLEWVRACVPESRKRGHAGSGN
jgi:hypothetical protein